METVRFIIAFLMTIAAIGAYIPVIIDLKNKKPMNPVSWTLWLFIDILILISLIQIKGDIKLIIIYTFFTGIIAIWSLKTNKSSFNWFEIFISISVVIGGIIMKMNVLPLNANIILTSSLAVISGIPYGIFLYKEQSIKASTMFSALLFLSSAILGLILNLIGDQDIIFSSFIGWHNTPNLTSFSSHMIK